MSETDNNNLPEKIPNFVIFQTADGKVNIDVYFHDGTLWLTQKFIAELFGKGRSTITEHLKKSLPKANFRKNWYVGNSDTPLLENMRSKHE
jgi:hypothetical protein